MHAGFSQIVTPPAREPVTLQEAKNHLRIDHSDADLMLVGHIKAAREHIEMQTRRALITRTVDVWYDYFGACMELPAPPLIGVSGVYYLDADDVEQTLDAAIYRVDAIHEPGRIYREQGQSWPVLYDAKNTVRVRFTAGYGTEPSDIPEPLRLAMLFHLEMLYDSDPRTRATLEATVRSLIASHVVLYV